MKMRWFFIQKLKKRIYDFWHRVYYLTLSNKIFTILHPRAYYFILKGVLLIAQGFIIHHSRTYSSLFPRVSHSILKGLSFYSQGFLVSRLMIHDFDLYENRLVIFLSDGRLCHIFIERVHYFAI